MFRIRALIYKGKRLFIAKAKLSDTGSAFLSHEMQKKRVCVFILSLWFVYLLGFTVVSIQSRFDTSRFDTNRSRFDTHVKSFRYTPKVDSIQTEVNSIKPLFT